MKLQVSVEFIFFVSFLLVVLLFVIIGNYSFYKRANELRIENSARKLCDKIASEINLAIKLGDGYRRKFFVDYSFEGITSFNISVSDYLVSVEWYGGRVTSSILTQNISGEVKKGWNIIENNKGEIYVE